jgi:hypothetical protein
MKKNIIVLSFAWFVSMGLPACKKDPVKETTPQEKIAGKWLVDTRISNEHYADQDHINSMPGMIMQISVPTGKFTVRLQATRIQCLTQFLR